MKILLVNGGCLDRTGVCLFTYQWSHELVTAFPGNTVTVYFKLHVVDESIQKAFEKDGVRIIAGNLSTGGTFDDKNNRAGIIKDLRSIFREHYDIVHIHSSVIGFTSLVLREARKANVPVRVAHAHGKFEETRLKKILHNIMRIYIRKEATVYAGCSKESGKYLFGRKGINNVKWHMVPNCIQTEHFLFDEAARTTRRAEIGIGEEAVLLGAVGYLLAVKNHTFLIDVMAELKKKNIPIKLIILGSGNLEESLKAKIRLLGLSEVVILYGKTSDVPGWLSAMDIYLMPSLSEGFPISAVEAQASGLPCLLSDKISEEVDITDLVCHLSINKGPGAWTEKIVDLCSIQICSDNKAQRKKAAKEVSDAGFGTTALKHTISKIYGIDLTDTD